ncbi:unnamed protein product [Citrullus colocynthis]|uniref:Prolamin-like domain-containing protein n=1 Tax=Citrullus colocynthis TaxID=252529 RepID=A0ABP0XZ58_9ROSI
MAKGNNTMGAIVILLLAINLAATLVQSSGVDEDYNSPIWDGWVDEDRGINLRPCLDRMKSAKCQVELYNYYFNISKKELDMNCCVFVKVMGKKCARAFASWYQFPGLEIYEPNPMKVYNNCVRRLGALPPAPF